MPANQAVSQELFETVQELQKLSSLSSFGIAGGTCLALRLNHRTSIDIDLFSPQLLGVAGMQKLCDEIEIFFGEKRILSSQLINDDMDDQYCFS